MTYKLICIAFDGDYVTERPTFGTLEEVAEYDNNMGSRWFFYPFHFPVTASGKTIADSFSPVEFLKGKRVTTVRRMFAKLAGLPELQNADCDQFLLAVRATYCWQ